jgi:hypothetical protein
MAELGSFTADGENGLDAENVLMLISVSGHSMTPSHSLV